MTSIRKGRGKCVKCGRKDELFVTWSVDGVSHAICETCMQVERETFAKAVLGGEQRARNIVRMVLAAAGYDSSDAAIDRLVKNVMEKKQ